MVSIRGQGRVLGVRGKQDQTKQRQQDKTRQPQDKTTTQPQGKTTKTRQPQDRTRQPIPYTRWDRKGLDYLCVGTQKQAQTLTLTLTILVSNLKPNPNSSNGKVKREKTTRGQGQVRSSAPNKFSFSPFGQKFIWSKIFVFTPNLFTPFPFTSCVHCN